MESKSTKIKNLVKDNTAIFQYYRDKCLWYKVESLHHDPFIFPVPIEDIGIATFNREEKAILLMRYIRKYMNEIEKEQSNG